MNHYFVVCDQEKQYVERLTEAVSERGLVPYPIEGITDADALKTFCAEHRVELLLIEEELADEQIMALPIRCIVRMGSTPDAQQAGKVFKYQPVTLLLEEALNALHEVQDTALNAEAPLLVNTRVIGVYSPVKGVNGASFAPALGLALAKEQRVLYLNFRPLTGLQELLSKPEAPDLSDVLYLMQSGADCTKWSRRCVQSMDGMDYILPVISPADLHDIPQNSLCSVISLLKESGRYDTIVVEFGEETGDFFSLLMLCDTLYTQESGDCRSQAQMTQYEQLLQKSGYGAVLDKTVRIRPPMDETVNGGSFAKQLMWSKLGDYVRSLLWGTRG